MDTLTVTVLGLAGGDVAGVDTADGVGAEVAVDEGGAVTATFGGGGVEAGEHPAVARPISITPAARTGIMDDPVLRSTRAPADWGREYSMSAMPTWPFRRE